MVPTLSMTDYIPIVSFPIGTGYHRMTKEDIQACLLVAPAHVDCDIDYISLTNILHRYDIIDDQKCRHFREMLPQMRMNHTKRQFFMRYFTLILRMISLDDLVLILMLEGCDSFASALLCQRYCGHIFHQNRVDMPNATLLHKYFQNMKSFVDNGVFFPSAGSQLKKQINSLKLKLDEETNSGRQQWLGDKIAILVYLLVQQFKSVKIRRKILDYMKTAVPHGADTNLVDIVYYSKMASTEQQEEDLNLLKALDHIQHAKSLASICKPSFVSTLVQHDTQFVYRKQYERDPSDDILSNLLLSCDMGIHSLEYATKEAHTLWARIFLLDKVQGLLSIGTHLEIVDTHEPSKANIERATDVLREVKQMFQGIEIRRKMIYSLCMGRANETNISLALDHVRQAKILAQQGGVFRNLEKENIDKYLNFLESKQNTSS